MSERAWKSNAQSVFSPVDEGLIAGSESPQTRSFFAKRLFDFVVSLCGLVVLAPVFLIISIVIKAKYPSVPVLFANPVVGKNGRPFRMWKFSTMVPDAHIILADLLEGNEALRNEWNENVKLQYDPRILPGVGDFLRRSSLNELPQLYNVLIGDMSLVGPRPITKAEEDHYIRIGGIGILARRHSQRPGITGLWQATGRSDVSYEERIVLDNAYLRSQSFGFDLKILWWTVRKVISRKGAF